MKKIPLTQGEFALVDDADFEWLSQWKWYASAHRGWFRVSRFKKINGKQQIVYMHRLILDTPAGMSSDHINGDTLDNRRINLRICTVQQNNMNARKRNKGTSAYKGSFWSDFHNRWRGQIVLDHKKIHLGFFFTAEEAARSYDKAAVEYFGKFAKLNFQPNHASPQHQAAYPAEGSVPSQGRHETRLNSVVNA